MGTEKIIEWVTGNTDFKRLDDELITQYVTDSIAFVGRYSLPETAVNRAVYLHTCSMLFSDFPNHSNQYQTVKAENATYTRFDNGNTNRYEKAFQDLLDSYNLGNWVKGFE